MSHEIHEPDRHEGEQFQTIIGQDPWLEEFARNPYDPLNSARATGRLTGLAAREVYRKGWMRIVSFLLGFALVASPFGALLTLNIARDYYGLLLSIPFAIVGVRLIHHAIHPPH